MVSNKHKHVRFEEGHSSPLVSKLMTEILLLRSLRINEKELETLFEEGLNNIVLKTKILLSITDSIDEDARKKRTPVPHSESLHWRTNLERKSTQPKLEHKSQSKSKVETLEPFTFEQMANLLNVTISDMPLIVSIASAFRADVLKKVTLHPKNPSKQKKKR